jgi:CMP-N,N'-diacetyllegionaminic acid synthase
MIEGKKVLAIIPARGGSKGVPGKNIRIVSGKPLIAYSIEQASLSLYIDRAIVSTDDLEIFSVARSWGGDVPFVRPASLARDESESITTVLHALMEIPGYDLVVLLQPTSPLRRISDIDECIKSCVVSNSPACVSLSETRQSPYWMFTLDDNRNLVPVIKADSMPLRRQDLPSVYAINGAVYVARTDWIMTTKAFITGQTSGYLMPLNRSLDIDTEEDFQLLDSILRMNNGKA